MVEIFMPPTEKLTEKIHKQETEQPVFTIEDWSGDEGDFVPDIKGWSETENQLSASETDEEDFLPDIEGWSKTEETEKEEIKEIRCINQEYEGKEHPPGSGVVYERKVVVNDKGEKVEGVFPQFDSKFDAQLPEELYQASNYSQEKECNKQLKEAVENDPELAKKFNEDQLKDIKDGDTPEGYTWHHNEDQGKMQLVDSREHKDSRHTGGQVVWAGGKENR